MKETSYDRYREMHGIEAQTLKQSRRMSFIEATTNSAIGFALSVFLTIVIWPLFGMHPNLTQSIASVTLFTIASVARSFIVRRMFEELRSRGIQ